MKLKFINFLAVISIISLNFHQVNAQNESIDVSIEDLDLLMNTPMTLESISNESIGVNQNGIEIRSKDWRFRLGPIGSGTLALAHLTIQVVYTVQNKKFASVISNHALLSGGGFGLYYSPGAFTWNISNSGKDLSWSQSGVLGFGLSWSGQSIGWSRWEYFKGDLHLDDFGDFDGDGGEAELINVNRF